MEKPIKRRRFLKIAGATTILFIGGVAYRSIDQAAFRTAAGPAYEPWQNWQHQPEKGSLELVRMAILAANPHNSQPWRFHVSSSQIDLFADVTRNIGAIDPYLREMYIGLGCALENLLLAATANGYGYKLDLLPNQADNTHIAKIELTQTTPIITPLYTAIPYRHTNRGIYDTNRTLAKETFTSLQALQEDLAEIKIRWFVTQQERTQLGNLIIAATKAIIADEEQVKDSGKWFRMTQQNLQRYRDGITIDAMGFSPWKRSLAKILPPLSATQNHQFWLQDTENIHTATAAALGIILVRDVADKSQCVNGGRYYQRMHLWATEQKIAMHPLNQITERIDRERQKQLTKEFGHSLDILLEEEGWQALMTFRMGYAQRQALPSPRRAVEDTLI